MALTDKTQTALPVAASSAVLPARLPDLPADVLTRFPSLADWAEAMQRMHARVREALDGMGEDLSYPISTLQNSVKTVSATADGLSARVSSETQARIDGDTALASTISAIIAAAGTSSTVFVQTGSPTANSINDIWYDSDDGFRPRYWNGTAWADITDTRLTGAVAAIAAESIARANADSALTTTTNSLLATVADHTASISTILSTYATTTFAESKKSEAITAAAADAAARVATETAARVAADGSIYAQWGVALDVNGRIVGRINLNGTNQTSTFLVASDNFVVQNGAGTVTLVDIRAGGNIVFGANVQSDNYAAGSAGWSITRAGSAEFNDVTVRGTLYSTSGTIGGFTLASNNLNAGSGASYVELGSSSGIKLGGTDSTPGFGNNVEGFSVEPGTNALFISRASVFCASFNRNSSGAAVVFSNNGSIVGSVSVTGSNTAYNTTSDHRLKTDVKDAYDVGHLLDAIQVRTFEFKREPGKRHLGFIAQELYWVVPDAVTPGDTNVEVETAWSVDYSKLVPLLVREVQSLRQRLKNANL